MYLFSSPTSFCSQNPSEMEHRSNDLRVGPTTHTPAIEGTRKLPPISNRMVSVHSFVRRLSGLLEEFIPPRVCVLNTQPTITCNAAQEARGRQIRGRPDTCVQKIVCPDQNQHDLALAVGCTPTHQLLILLTAIPRYNTHPENRKGSRGSNVRTTDSRTETYETLRPCGSASPVITRATVGCPFCESRWSPAGPNTNRPLVSSHRSPRHRCFVDRSFPPQSRALSLPLHSSPVCYLSWLSRDFRLIVSIRNRRSHWSSWPRLSLVRSKAHCAANHRRQPLG